MRSLFTLGSTSLLTLAVAQLGCSSTSVNAGAGGAAGSSGSTGAGATGGSGASGGSGGAGGTGGGATGGVSGGGSGGTAGMATGGAAGSAAAGGVGATGGAAGSAGMAGGAGAAGMAGAAGSAGMGGASGSAGTSGAAGMAGMAGAGGAGGSPTCSALVCGRDTDGMLCGVSTNTTNFTSATNWRDSFTDAQGWNVSAYNWATLTLADVNGDGHSDICGRSSNNGILCAVSNGVDGFETATTFAWVTAFTNGNGWDDDTNWATVQFPDVNGDGAADVCARSDNGIVCGLSNGTDAFSVPTLWTGRFSDTDGWNTSPDHWGTIQFPDVDGDGRADVCGRSTNGILCAVSDGTAFVDPAAWTAGFSDAGGWDANPDNWGTIQFPDLNGDGAADVCGRSSNNGLRCGLSNGTDAFGTLSTWTPGYTDSNGYDQLPRWGTLAYPDVNGDGNADVCARNGAGIECAISDGAQFGPVASWSSAYTDAGGWGANTHFWATVQFVDVNDDGMQDVCGRGSSGLRCGVSTGTSFGATTTWLMAFNTGTWLTEESQWRPIQFGLVGAGCSPLPGAYQLPWRTSALAPRTGSL